MSVSSHRKLNTEQLINLAQVYWDDPTKLMEIVDATEGRVDQAAQLLFASVTNRLDRLRRDPAHALAEETPDLATLIAERLGKGPPDREAGEVESAAAAADVGKEKPRRRWPLALLALLLLLAGGAWFFWPATKEEKKFAAGGEPGIEILEQGERVEEEVKRGAAPSSLTGRRQAELPLRREFERQTRDAPVHDAADPASGGRVPPLPRAAAIEEMKEPPGARAGAAGSGGQSAVRGTAQQDSGGSPRVPRATSPAAAKIPASPGIAIAEAQLECFLSDSRPTACGAPPAGARSAGAGGGGGGSTAPSPAAATRATPSPPAAAAASGASQSPLSPPGARGESASTGGGSGGGNRSGGGGAPSGTAASTPSASSGARPSSQAAAGGGGGAASPPPQQRPPAQQQQPNQPEAPAPPDPDCPTEPQPGRVVFIFDGSVSMGLPLGLDPAEEDRLDEGTLRKDPEARREYRALLQQPGPKRMGRAQLAFTEATEDLPDHVELGLVVFQECRDIRQVGLFGAGRRGPAIDYIRAMIPRGRTPLAQSLMVAQEMLDTAKGSIVLLTDGREFCNGDPCAVAEHVKATRPGVPIHIIDIAGQGRTECVAEITGGRSYAPSETEDLSRVLRAAFRGAASHCPDTR